MNETQELTDEVADVEGLVAGPERVVDVGVPPVVGAHDVVRRGAALSCQTGERGDDQEPRHGLGLWEAGAIKMRE